MRGFFDTSIFIAQEQERKLGELPDEAAISVITLAELHVGVLLARSPRARAERLRTLGRVGRSFDPIPIDDAVAPVLPSWSRMSAERTGIQGL